ncbi:MAG: hypothetical protein HKN44_05220 [Ilumatobacter sp.]|nr:hypothetical protein [Ilumatobacter sp.]
MLTVVVRVWMPDRPGALGQVASRIGAVRGDVLGIEILEQGAGRAIDELTVQLPDPALIPLLTAEIDAVDGVSVENIREVDHERSDANLAALAVAAGLAECPADRRLAALCTGVQRIVEADWVVAVRDGDVVSQLGDVPDIAWLSAFLAGSGHLDGADERSTGGRQRTTPYERPSDLVWANLLETGLTVAAGRTGRPIHERERVRISLLARLADALL